jgi:hypothetical protein
MVIFSDGFESGDFSAWTGTAGSPSVSDTAEHSGVYGCISSRGTWTGGVYAEKDLSSNYSSLWKRGYYKNVSGGPAASGFMSFITFRSSGGTNVCHGGIYNDDGSYYYAIRIGSSNYVSEVSVDANFHCLELEAVFAADGHVKLYVDGVSAVNQAYSSAGVTVAVIRCGQYTDWGGHGAAGVVHFDCVVADSSYIGTESAGGMQLFTLLNEMGY